MPPRRRGRSGPGAGVRVAAGTALCGFAVAALALWRSTALPVKARSPPVRREPPPPQRSVLPSPPTPAPTDGPPQGAAPAGATPRLPAWARRSKHASRAAAGPAVEAWPANSTLPAGIVTYVGNDKYADGAFVVAHSAAKAAPCTRPGARRRCRTGVLVAQKVDARISARYAGVFDDVWRVNRSLSRVVRGTPWGTTFDKFWLWNLTAYSVLVFFDADMVITKNPEGLLRTLMPADHHWLGALGGGGGYFATGTMVLRPDAAVLGELLEFYQSVLDNATDPWGFRGPNSRDGLVMRYFVSGRVVPISVPGLHFSGPWKPWFNRWGDRSEVKKMHAFLLKDRRDTFGPTHDRWWTEYEAVHMRHFISDSSRAEWKERWGAATSPDTHVWMLRHTKWEYTQPLGGYTTSGPTQ
eukprot:TRINITY_DN8945_c0_g1_i2.p1 TRINITY_DN8945_c0_g1~~TRINITY_DN8945_c0_g1_i2.p1  ORF type:complete len:442 (+),score=111.51 TRINITY_DN8945_c0_g1_i2:94-1326(+)